MNEVAQEEEEEEEEDEVYGERNRGDDAGGLVVMMQGGLAVMMQRALVLKISTWTGRLLMMLPQCWLMDKPSWRVLMWLITHTRYVTDAHPRLCN